MSERPTTTGTILMLPDFRRANPYQQLLADSLAAQGLAVTFPQGYRRGLPLLRQWLAAGRPATVHLHWLDPYLRAASTLGFTLYAAKLALDLTLVRLAGVRLVWTLHNLTAHEARHPRLERLLQRAVARLAHAVIVHDPETARAAAQALRVPEGRFHVIPLGHYRDAHGPAPPRDQARARLGLADGEALFLFLGMVRPYKGVLDLLDAWHDVHGRFSPPARLLVVGECRDDQHRAELEAAAQGLPDARLDLRRVPDEDVPALLAAADVALFPFRRVTTSSSLVLALSFGVPVVAPRLPQLLDAVGEAGDFLYDPAEPGALAAAILRAAQATGDEAPRARARASAARFDWGAIGAATSRLLAGTA